MNNKSSSNNNNSSSNNYHHHHHQQQQQHTTTTKQQQQAQIPKRSLFAILTGLQSHPPLSNQPSRSFELLCAILQQNDCTSSSFFVTL